MNDKINYRVENVTPQQVNMEEKTSQKGNDYIALGVKVNDHWYNGFLKTKANIEQGVSIALAFWQEEYNGELQNKVGLPNKTDFLEVRVARIEKHLGFTEDKGELQESPTDNPRTAVQEQPNQEQQPAPTPQEEAGNDNDSLPF